MRRRFVGSLLLNASHGSVKLRRVGLIGFSPLAVIAANRSERILAKLLGLISAAMGLIAFSRERSCARSRANPARLLAGQGAKARDRAAQIPDPDRREVGGRLLQGVENIGQGGTARGP